MLVNWSRIKKQFVGIGGYIYLNSASRTPLPRKTLEVVKKSMEDYIKDEVRGYQVYVARIQGARKLAAKMIHAKAENISLSTNTSIPLNMAAQGIDFKKGDSILLSDNEFPANVYPWLNLEKKGVRVKFVKSSNGIVTADDFERTWEKKTRAIAISFVNFHNGFRNDLKSLSALCRKNNAFLIVDGIQGAGVVELDVEGDGIDFFAAAGHKWLLSPYGSGFMYVSDRLKKHLGITLTNWLAAGPHRFKEGEFHSLLKYEAKYPEDGRRFEIGTMPFHNIFGFEESMKMILKIGVPAIEKRLKDLLDPLIYALHVKGIEIAGLLMPEHRSTILSFRMKKGAEIVKRLKRKGIIVSYREGLIRVSPHIFNTESDIQKLISALKL
jgi:selenocysteine lyase/cysteine desulfurase